MKKLLLAIFALSLSAFGQGLNSNTMTIRFAGVPSGPCSVFMLGVNNATNDEYNCGTDGLWHQIGSGGGGGAAFNAITSGTNTTAAMVVDSGASLTFSGTGALVAPEVSIIPYGADPTGVSDSLTAIQAAITAAIAAKKCVYIPAGTYIVSAGLTASSNAFCMTGAGASITSITASATGYNTLIIGPGSPTFTGPNGRLEDITIGGGARASDGHSAVQLSGTVQYSINRVKVATADIGFDFINNNYGSQVTNVRGGSAGDLNVGFNLRTGAQSGSDLTFNNPWVFGRVAAFYVAGGGGGYHVWGGQLGGGTSVGSDVDTNGTVVLGKDYLTGATGESSMDLHGTSFEATNNVWALRSYNSIHLVVDSCSFNPANASFPAIGFFKGESMASSRIELRGNGISGYWSAASLVSTTGFNSGVYWWEYGTYTAASNPVINGGSTYVQSIAGQGGILARAVVVDNSTDVSIPKLSMPGSTSGAATITPPAVAGTATNPVVFVNNIQAGNGTAAAPAFAVTSEASGIYYPQSGRLGFAVAGNSKGSLTSSGTWQTVSGGGFVWSNSTTNPNATLDTGFVRDSAGVVDLGTGSAGDKSGSLNLTNLTATGAVLFPSSANNVTTPAVAWNGGTAGYGIGGDTNHALNIYGPSGSASILANFVENGVPLFFMTLGNSSAANQNLSFQANGTANYSMLFAHSYTTSTSNPGFRFTDAGGGAGHMAAVSGSTQTHASFEASFIPASGSSPFVGLQVKPTINQTGTSSGSYTALLVNAVETALKGTSNKLLDLQAGATGGTSYFSVDNTGNARGASYISTGTKFTTNNGCTDSATAGGATAGTFTVGSTSCTEVVTMGNSATAPNGWSCTVVDITTLADVTNPHQTTSNATTATFVTGTVVSGDKIQFSCVGY